MPWLALSSTGSAAVPVGVVAVVVVVGVAAYAVLRTAPVRLLTPPQNRNLPFSRMVTLPGVAKLSPELL